MDSAHVGQQFGMVFRGEGVRGITVGPVVGLVTPTKARVLVETNFTGTLTCTAVGRPRVLVDEEGDGQHRRVFKGIEVQAGVPQTFELKKLRPNYQYHLGFDKPFFDLVHAGFVTPPGEDENLLEHPVKFAIVNGNSVKTYREQIPGVRTAGGDEGFFVDRTTHATTSSLWKDLYNRVADGGIKYVIHTGNNVAMEGTGRVFERCLDETPSAEDATQRFQSTYREAWNEPWTKHVLANASNIMIADETEIGRMVSYEKQYSDTRIEGGWTYAQIARNVYTQYQQALIADPPATLNSGPDSKFNMAAVKLTAELGLILFDWRSCATFGAYASSDLEGKVITPAQRDALRKALNKTFGDHSKVRSLIFVSPTDFTAGNNYLSRDENKEQVNDVLTELFAWKAQGPDNSREVTMITNPQRKTGWVATQRDIANSPERPQPRNTLFGFSVPPIARYINKALHNTPKTKTEAFAVSKSNKNDATNAYGILTAGQTVTQTNVQDAGHFPDGHFLIRKPVFWREVVHDGGVKGPLKDHSLAQFGEPTYKPIKTHDQGCTMYPAPTF